MISYENWGCSDEVLVARLEAVLNPYLPVLTEALEPSDSHEAHEAYLRSLEMLYYVSPSEEDFYKELKRRVDAAVGLGVESSRQVIRDYRNTKELTSLNLFIFEHAGKMIMTVFAGISEFERDLIRERTGTGQKAAMKRGVKFDRPQKLLPNKSWLCVWLMKGSLSEKLQKHLM